MKERAYRRRCKCCKEWKEENEYPKTSSKKTCFSCNTAHNRMVRKDLEDRRATPLDPPERKENKAHRVAWAKVGYAIKTGDIKKPSECQKCARKPKRIEGHHFDYSKPLDVIWLCASCHTKLHNNIGV